MPSSTNHPKKPRESTRPATLSQTPSSNLPTSQPSISSSATTLTPLISGPSPHPPKSSQQPKEPAQSATLSQTFSSNLPTAFQSSTRSSATALPPTVSQEQTEVGDLNADLRQLFIQQIEEFETVLDQVSFFFTEGK